MNLAKILKVKSFNKRMELVLNEIRGAEVDTRDEAVDSLCSTAKYPAHWISILALCVYFKSKKTDSVADKAISMIDNPLFVPEISGLLVIAGKMEDAKRLIESYKDQMGFAHKLTAAWYLIRFGGEKDISGNLIEEVESMKIDESKIEIRNNWVENVRATPSIPPFRSADFRYFLPENEAGFDWFGNSV